MNGIALPTASGMVDNHGQEPRLQGPSVAPGEGTGRGPVWIVGRHQRRSVKPYWAGAYFGVREPAPAETPLSWDEIMHGLRWEVL